MALISTPVALPHGGTTFGGFGAAAIAVGSRGRATPVLVLSSTAPSVLPLLSTFSFAAVSTFPAATVAVYAGVHDMACVAIVEPLLPVSRKSVMARSNSLNDVIAADTVTRCQVPCLHIVLGRQSVDEDGVQHVVVKCQSCGAHSRCNIFDPTHLERVAPRRYLKTIEASG